MRTLEIMWDDASRRVPNFIKWLLTLEVTAIHEGIERTVKCCIRVMLGFFLFLFLVFTPLEPILYKNRSFIMLMVFVIPFFLAWVEEAKARAMVEEWKRGLRGLHQQ